MNTVIFVAGATGNVGRHLVEELLACGHEVRALSRNPSAMQRRQHLEVRSAHAVDPASLRDVLEGVERVFVMVNMPGSPKQGAAWAEALTGSDVRRVVLMSSLTLTNTGAADPITEIHRRNESLIETTGVPAVFVRPGIFMSNARQWIPTVRSSSVVQGYPGNHPFAPVHEADIAAVVARSLFDDDLVGKRLPVTGSETMRPSDQVGTLAEVLGRPLEFQELPAEVVIRAMAPMAGDLAESLLDSMAGPDASWRRPTRTVETVVGRPALTWREWCVEHAGEFS